MTALSHLLGKGHRREVPASVGSEGVACTGPLLPSSSSVRAEEGSGGAHSHLFPHLLEVIEQLQGSAQAFCNEAAALTTAAHEPEGQLIRHTAPAQVLSAAPSHPTPHCTASPSPSPQRSTQ